MQSNLSRKASKRKLDSNNEQDSIDSIDANEEYWNPPSSKKKDSDFDHQNPIVIKLEIEETELDSALEITEEDLKPKNKTLVQKKDGTNWKFLEHKGPLFAPPYERLPKYVNFYYDGKIMELSEEAEECSTFYGKMLDHKNTEREVFKKNFFQDWRESMTDKEKEKIQDFSKCDFTQINTHFKKVIIFKIFYNL